jgi:hypothetical protein
MNRINAAGPRENSREFEAEASRIRIVAKAKKQKVNVYKDKGIADQRREIAKG